MKKIHLLLAKENHTEQTQKQAIRKRKIAASTKLMETQNNGLGVEISNKPGLRLLDGRKLFFYIQPGLRPVHGAIC